MSYKKNAASNRDALFGPPAASSGRKHKKNAAANRDALFGDRSGDSSRKESSKSSSASSTSSKPKVKAPPAPSNATGYQPRKKKSSVSSLSGSARDAKLKEAEQYREKANQAMKQGLFRSADPVAASTFFKRAADCYKVCGEVSLERVFRLQSATCNQRIGTWGSTAEDFTRAAELTLEDETLTDMEQKRRDASDYHKQAAEAYTQMGEKAKAAESLVNAALAFSYGDSSNLLSKNTLTGIEEAVEKFVPDPINPYARYRQTGYSAFIDPDSDETVAKPSASTLSMANEMMVTRAYSHEPLQELVYMLVSKGEYASALYAAGAASAILEKDGLSTLSLSRAYCTETILLLALGDPIGAEQEFLKRHVQKTSYLNSRECQLSEELFRAIKNRDAEGLEEVRDPIEGRNRACLSNMHPTVRELVTMLRLSGMARREVADTTSVKSRKTKTSKKAAPAKPVLSLDELAKKTGYEEDIDAGKNLDSDALQNELDGLGLDDDLEFLGGDSDGDLSDDDDIDLR